MTENKFKFFFSLGVMSQILADFYESAADAFTIGLTTNFDLDDLDQVDFEFDEDQEDQP